MTGQSAAAVIGAGNGIGRGFALTLAARGLHVGVGDIDPDAAQRVVEEIELEGGIAKAFAVDGTSAESIQSFAADVEASLGTTSHLVANLGISLERPLVEASIDEWEWMINFNLLSAVKAVNAFVPQLRRADGARHVLITASLAGLIAPTRRSWDGEHRGIYVTTKHALYGYSEILRAELASEQIVVSLLCPGLVTTNMGVTSALHGPDGRAGAPSDLGSVPQPLDGLDPIVLARMSIQAMEAGRFLIPAPTEAISMIDERHARLVDDFRYVKGLGL